MNSRITAVIFFVLALCATAAQAEIYKWVDENGRVHFGDSPREQDNAEKITVDVISYEYVKIENIEFYTPEKRAGRAPDVVMYSTVWCGYCKKARNYFNASGIRFTEYDIEQDSAAHSRFKAAGGKGVPLILVGDKKMSGFNIDRFLSIYP